MWFIKIKYIIYLIIMSICITLIYEKNKDKRIIYDLKSKVVSAENGLLMQRNKFEQVNAINKKISGEYEHEKKQIENLKEKIYQGNSYLKVAAECRKNNKSDAILNEDGIRAYFKLKDGINVMSKK